MDDLRALQMLELDILKEVLKLFEKHGIQYFAIGGTLLGAVRHRGFIPWDDDIDLGIPREDYEKLPEIVKELPDHLHYQSFETDPSYRLYFAKIVDSRIQLRTSYTVNDVVESAWIDLFPMDGMPKAAWLRKLHGWWIMACRALFVTARFDELANVARENRPAHEKAFMWLVKTFRLQKLLGRRWTYRLLDRALKRCPYAASAYNINGLGLKKLREVFPQTTFGEGALYPFEDVQLRGPLDYETFLTQIYGDWRTPDDLTHHKVSEIVINDR